MLLSCIPLLPAFKSWDSSFSKIAIVIIPCMKPGLIILHSQSIRGQHSPYSAVQMALKPGKGWAGIEDAFRLLPGPHFMIQQTVDGEGLPIETSAPLSRPMTGASTSGLDRMEPTVSFSGIRVMTLSCLSLYSEVERKDVDVSILGDGNDIERLVYRQSTLMVANLTMKFIALYIDFFMSSTVRYQKLYSL